MRNKEYPYNMKYHRKLRGVLVDLNRDLFLIEEKMKTYHDNHSSDISFQLFWNEELDDLHVYVMALEDRRFFQHCGVDFRAIVREFLKFRKRKGGASTIDMQLVRTITNFRERTLFRKLYESLLAVIINFKYTKRQIIDCYLSNAFFGSHLYGLDSLMHDLGVYHYDEINYEMKSRIASMLQLPRPLQIDSNKEKLEQWERRLSDRSFYAQMMRFRVKYSSDQSK